MTTYFAITRENIQECLAFGKTFTGLEESFGKIFIDLINTINNIDIIDTILIGIRNKKIFMVNLLKKRYTFTEECITFVKDLKDLKDLDSSVEDKDDLEKSLEKPVDTEIRMAVWKEIAKIPKNETRTYSEIAELIGRPKAVRAVANACGTNNIAILIPCHRVVPKNYKSKGYGGYRWGTDVKERLLNLEKRDFKSL